MAPKIPKQYAQIGFVVWTVVILYLLLSPTGPKTDPFYLFENEDKLVHFTLFFSWVILLYLGWETVSKSLVIVLIVLMAGGTEILQQFVPNRTADMWDFVADTVGGMSALGMSFFLKRN
ncbi:MAG: VanZ family protein [Cyclobacteriaceae bacterium]